MNAVSCIFMRILVASLLAAFFVLSSVPAAFAVHPAPFNGLGSGTFAATPTTVTVRGAGFFEQLGFTTISATATTTGVPACGAFFTTEDAVYTASNGDTLNLLLGNVACTAAGHGVFKVTGSFSVVGGTGHFSEATGSGVISGTATFLSSTSGTFRIAQTGTIEF
jgi:hypothetical protein